MVDIVMLRHTSDGALTIPIHSYNIIVIIESHNDYFRSKIGFKFRLPYQWSNALFRSAGTAYLLQMLVVYFMQKLNSTVTFGNVSLTRVVQNLGFY